MAAEELDASIVDAMLRPLEGDSGPSGVDLEYDNAFLEMVEAAGKPESQFIAGVAADWSSVKERAESLFVRTRDLRVADYWARACVNLFGLAALPPALRLLNGLIAEFWDTVHPLLSEAEPKAMMRSSALGALSLPEGLLGDVRQAYVFRVREVGQLRVREVEIALGALQAREGDQVLTRFQVEGMSQDAVNKEPEIKSMTVAASNEAALLRKTLDANFAGDDDAVDLAPLQKMIRLVASVIPEPQLEEAAAAGADVEAAPAPDEDTFDAPAAIKSPAASGRRHGAASLGGAIGSRADAVAAIDAVCVFLDQTEPTNPAQLLLRRARKLIDRNFLQLMKELAPASLEDVARVMGVDPQTVLLEDPSS